MDGPYQNIPGTAEEEEDDSIDAVRAGDVLGFIVAPTSAYPTGKVVEVTEAEQLELQAILDGWRKAGFLDR